MKLITLTLAGLLAAASPALAAETGSGMSRSGTANSTGPNDAGSGSTPGAKGSGPSTGSLSRSGTTNSTGANDAGSGAKPGSTGR
ncbi:hypothetical protein MKK69_10000 [Methylobacterium sp. J-026]|uniref:hypothetical protein n=1 Tax=Methylobacterium sp. J-026 TaxID=2836624 RepID=UPI001FB917F3|nr:hypothetical protein [Methylobacterium sp. J-026]MCJ2134381.1 hypothetical protein [Methylobacterium sp. J-026]